MVDDAGRPLVRRFVARGHRTGPSPRRLQASLFGRFAQGGGFGGQGIIQKPARKAHTAAPWPMTTAGHRQDIAIGHGRNRDGKGSQPDLPEIGDDMAGRDLWLFAKHKKIRGRVDGQRAGEGFQDRRSGTLPGLAVTSSEKQSGRASAGPAGPRQRGEAVCLRPNRPALRKGRGRDPCATRIRCPTPNGQPCPFRKGSPSPQEPYPYRLKHPTR
jgi:hypothetical protein